MGKFSLAPNNPSGKEFLEDNPAMEVESEEDTLSSKMLIKTDEDSRIQYKIYLF